LTRQILSAITKYYRSYMNTYLQCDSKNLAQVADEMSFYNFMTIVAARTAKPIVYDEIAKDAGISAPTAKKWLLILVSSHHHCIGTAVP
jgi:predicted AAA+ superfamily ATPase